MTDAEALERFEAIVLGQQAAESPWTPVTDYSFDARKQIEGDHPRLILEHLLDCDDADVLDYGCGPGLTLVRLLQDERRAMVTVDGYDPQLPGTERLLERGRVYELVICREVLEHCTIREIRRIVSELCALSTRLVYVTTRFHLAPRHLLDVMTADDLDPTHISMLNQTFLRTLFVLEGFKRRADLEQRMDWQGKGRCLVYERAA
jgi:hypothetical protein